MREAPVLLVAAPVLPLEGHRVPPEALGPALHDAVEAAHVGLEAPPDRSLTPLAEAEVPLAHHVGGVARLPQQLRHGGDVGWQAGPAARVDGEGEAGVVSVATSHQGGPGDRVGHSVPG